MVRKEENKESTTSSSAYVTVDETEQPLMEQLRGLLANKGYGKLPLESISAFLNAVEKFASISKANASIIFKPARTRFLRLHKNTYLLEIMVFPARTNNNTHTPVKEAGTP